MLKELTVGVTDLRQQLRVVDTVLNARRITAADRDNLEGLDNFLSEVIAAFRRYRIVLLREGTFGDVQPSDTVAVALVEALREIEQRCPCGARPESPETHSHVGGCPVSRSLDLVTSLLAATAPDRALHEETCGRCGAVNLVCEHL